MRSSTRPGTSTSSTSARPSRITVAMQTGSTSCQSFAANAIQRRSSSGVSTSAAHRRCCSVPDGRLKSAFNDPSRTSSLPSMTTAGSKRPITSAQARAAQIFCQTCSPESVVSAPARRSARVISRASACSGSSRMRAASASRSCCSCGALSAADISTSQSPSLSLTLTPRSVALFPASARCIQPTAASATSASRRKR